MYCKHCGKEIADDSTFCRFCGKNVGDITPGEPDSPILQLQQESPYPRLTGYTPPPRSAEEIRLMRAQAELEENDAQENSTYPYPGDLEPFETAHEYSNTDQPTRKKGWSLFYRAAFIIIAILVVGCLYQMGRLIIAFVTPPAPQVVNGLETEKEIETKVFDWFISSVYTFVPQTTLTGKISLDGFTKEIVKSEDGTYIVAEEFTTKNAFDVKVRYTAKAIISYDSIAKKPVLVFFAVTDFRGDSTVFFSAE